MLKDINVILVIRAGWLRDECRFSHVHFELFKLFEEIEAVAVKAVSTSDLTTTSAVSEAQLSSLKVRLSETSVATAVQTRSP